MWTETTIATYLYDQPVWLHWVGTFLLLMLAYQAGALLQRYLLRDPCTEPETALVGSALALLVFVLGFSFSIAHHRHDQRRELVLVEANAIGTTWLRAQLAPEPHRSALEQIILRYADTRLALFEIGEDMAELRRFQTESEEELAELWEASLRAVPAIQPAPAASLLIQAVNDTVDVAEARRTTYVERLPRPVIFALTGFAVITAGLSGFARGGRRHFILSVFTYVMLSSVIALIIDLDRPSAGAIRIVPGPLINTRADMALTAPGATAAVAGSGLVEGVSAPG